MTNKSDALITCPKCGQEFNPSDSILHAINQQKDILENELRKNLFKEWEDESRKKEQDYQKQIKERESALKEAQEKELLALKKEREAANKLQQMDIEVEKRAMVLIEAQTKELKRSMEENANQKIKMEKDRIEHNYQDKINQKDQELLQAQKQLLDTQKKLQEAKDSSNQVSQQMQGEVIELSFKENLESHFPDDKINDVPKGVEGADIIQEVFHKGRSVGTILWEIKNTKSFSKQWIDKLKKDQRDSGAELAVIATSALPKDALKIDYYEGVYIIALDLAIPACIAFRRAIIKVAESLGAQENKGTKMELMYDYLISVAFKQKVEAIIETYKKLRDGIESEKRAMGKIWAKREKELGIVIDSTAKMYGELQAIAGGEMSEISSLELGYDNMAIEDDTEEE